VEVRSRRRDLEPARAHRVVEKLEKRARFLFRHFEFHQLPHGSIAIC